ncbi:MAG: FAD-dependent oxidoreductase [Clostridiales bacterium]|nr:FAD-dependent oxidoreductase [Clostridiales bacterium]
MKHVIIGAGAAGITAARTIRKLRPEDDIVILSEDKQISSRCMLHQYISGGREAERLRFVPEHFMEENRIAWINGHRAASIDTSAKCVHYEEGSVEYDKLLVATGSDSVIIPVGALRTAQNVSGLRHFTDAQTIREAAEGAQKIVIIGAGLVGLDAAYALLERKKDVTVIDVMPGILTVNLDEHAARAYYDRFSAAGCHFRLGAKMAGTVEDAAGNVVQVELDDGERLPCDFVIVAAGVRPAIGFLEGSGISVDRAINVNAYLETSCPGVYAAGDAAGLSGIWPNAMRQGEIAAKNMCGASVEYTDTFAIKNTVNFFGLPSLSVGLLNPEEGDVVQVREDRNTYQKVILREGCVAGVILQGDIAGSGFWQYLIKNRIPVDGINKPIWKLSYADFFGMDDAGEYIYAANG